jgi:hypothetical protein
LDIPIDYDNLISIGSMMGSGGMIVMDEDNCMVDIAKFFLEFTVDESCGKCPPCRIGTRRMHEMLTKITEGRGEPGDIEKLERLAQNIKASALCGLGQTAPNPVLSTIRYFRDEYEAHINEKRCPAGVCKALLSYTIDRPNAVAAACAQRSARWVLFPVRSRARTRSIKQSASNAALAWKSANSVQSRTSNQLYERMGVRTSRTPILFSFVLAVIETIAL